MKVFRDSVHGYIKIPKNFCEHFIDTPIFQRLRHIEQTSMRCLFPSARHDRFIHSLGTFHLGVLAFQAIKENGSELLNQLEIKPEEIDNYGKIFSIACLLHDCAHAPFSHTFEEYYDKSHTLKTSLLDLFHDDPCFSSDFASCNPSEHEKASAIVLLRCFKNEIQSMTNINGPFLAGRMIMGCTYHDCATDNKKRIENSLIMLLNGKAVDVDKLDYITRDTWASGVNNASIDINRLLGSLTIVEHEKKVIPAFKKQALSVVQSVLDAKNNLYRWIYGHHKVYYHNELLVKAVEELACEIGSQAAETREAALSKMFSVDAFFEPQKIGDITFTMPSDGDLIYLLKQYQNKIPQAKEWLSRKHKLIAIWKTRAEFDNNFKNQSQDDLNNILRQLSSGALKKLPRGGEYQYYEVKIKESRIHDNALFIVLDDKPISYTEFFKKDKSVGEGQFFYLYKPIDDNTSKTEVVEFLKSLV